MEGEGRRLNAIKGGGKRTPRVGGLSLVPAYREPGTALELRRKPGALVHLPRLATVYATFVERRQAQLAAEKK